MNQQTELITNVVFHLSRFTFCLDQQLSSNLSRNSSWPVYGHPHPHPPMLRLLAWFGTVSAIRVDARWSYVWGWGDGIGCWAFSKETV